MGLSELNLATHCKIFGTIFGCMEGLYLKQAKL